MSTKSLRFGTYAALLLTTLGAGALSGCSVQTSVGTSADEVTSVENTSVKSQGIGNCWLYATAGWAESLYKGATGRDTNLSEAYWNYWYWYEEITQGDVVDGTSGLEQDGKIVEGGYWGVAVELIRRYGWMNETDFLPSSDPNFEPNARNYINASLASGALSTAEARKNPQIVRSELNKAWQLTPDVVAELEILFSDGAPTLTNGTAITSTSSSIVHAPSQLQVLAADGAHNVTLGDVIGTRAENSMFYEGLRVGDEAWSEVQYEWGSASEARHKAILKNVQEALNRRLAVPVAWFVAPLEQNGYFQTSAAQPDQVVGGHESILVDYEVQNVPGFGTLHVDQQETRPDALEATLSDDAQITLFEIKNSWGADGTWTAEELRQAGATDTDPSHYGVKPNYLPSKPGYNHIDRGYFDAAFTNYSTTGHFGRSFAIPPVKRFPIPAVQ